MVDVRQSKMLIRLPRMQLVVKYYWNRPGLQDSVGGDFFSVHKYTNKRLKSIFTVYCILTVSININFSFILETKSSSFLVLNG